MQLEFSGTTEEQHSQSKQALQMLWDAVKGNGKPGLEVEMQNVKEQQAEMIAIGRTCLAWIKGVGTLLAIMVAAIGVYVAILEYRVHLGALHLPKIHQQQSYDSTYNVGKTDAAIPPLVRR